MVKKIKNKRGVTLAEVLIVLAIMGIMLGVAVPNLLSYCRQIKLTEMHNNAHAVAVAVQSKLYGMKNSGTSIGSEYWTLNETAATEVSIAADGETETVKCVSNFGDKGAEGKRYLLSGALTDTEVLQNGKIVVLYNPETANVIQTYYSENDFNINSLLGADESYLKSNMIGFYKGENSSAPERKVRVPEFSCNFVFSDELYLEMTMTETPSEKLNGKRLGLEIYAEIPGKNGEGTEEIGIYYQGMFATQYTTTTGAGTIQSDGDFPNALTIADVQSNGGRMRFSLDSMITDSAGYRVAKPYLRHQNYPQCISVTESLLYPRESLAAWLSPQENPYITVWYLENKSNVSPYVKDLLFKDSQGLIPNRTDATDFVAVAQTMRLRVRISVLSDETKEATDTSGAMLYQVDENFASFETYSDAISPYFNALSNDDHKITLSALRDLMNLHYVFSTENTIDKAELNQDISGQQTYNKFVDVRYALLKKCEENGVAAPDWALAANWSAIQSVGLNPSKEFTLSGKKSQGGQYAIVDIALGGRANTLGGLFGYANGLTVKDLDIVNPSTMRNGFNHDFLNTDDSSGNIAINTLYYSRAISGSLVGIAVNCSFDNVHVYIDADRDLQVEAYGNTLANHSGRQTLGFGYRRTSGVIAGGLVGIAIGSNGESTTFNNCSASIIVGTEMFDRTSKCICSGGLVGITMGNVNISDSYAACQQDGYNAGGLIGCVVKPQEWKYSSGGWYGGYYDGTWHSSYYEDTGTGSGNLTVTSSFASGIIQRQVRVGGGLIANVGNTTPDVTNCYSSVKWQILPPVAYGTFKGDKSNYYINQTYIAVPITANTEAHFECEGSVFSLNGTEDSGIACANRKDLENRLGNDWTTAEQTYFWRREDLDHTGKNTYPFPMRTGNNVFSGSWIMSTKIGNNSTDPTVEFYDKESTSVPANFTSKFKGFFCAYYGAVAAPDQNVVDGGAIVPKKFSYDKNKVLLDGNELTDMWWIRSENSWSSFKKVESIATVSYKDGKFEFIGFAYNDPSFNPLQQDTFKSKYNDSFIKDGDTTFKWDYLGYYFGDMSKNKYYLKFNKDVDKGTVEIKDEYCYVNPDDFISKQKTFSLSESANIVYKDGCFCVEG